MREKIVFAITVLLACLTQTTWADNAQQARAIFNKAYNQVFGPQGATLHYAVNIVGIYKTEGTIWYKAGKSKYVESRYTAWNDGRTFCRADAKKHIVEIMDAHSPKKDKYASKFTFHPDDYKYSYKDTKEGRVVSLDAKSNAESSIKHAKIVLNRSTGAPQSLKVKVALFWTTIHISNFRSGGISDALFAFPQAKYKGWKVVDKR